MYNNTQLKNINESSEFHNCYSLAEVCCPRTLISDKLLLLKNSIQRCRIVKAGTTLFRQGEISNCIFAVRSGAVKTYIAANIGEEQVTGFYLPGEIFGLDGLNSEKHKCTCIALESSSVYEIQLEDINSLCVKIHELYQQLLLLISDEIIKNQAMLLLIAQGTAEQKIATFLLNYSVRIKATTFEIPMTRFEIGNLLGLVDHTVIRVISRFRRNKIINADKRKFQIVNYDQLSDIAEGKCSLK